METVTGSFISTSRMADQVLNARESKQIRNDAAGSKSFGEILAEKSHQASGVGVRFSKHASARLSDRKIEMTDEQLIRLGEGTDRAMAKGIKDSLVIVDDMAFIVNVPSRTVVTAIDSANTNENIFTNINGAVIA